MDSYEAVSYVVSFYRQALEANVAIQQYVSNRGITEKSKNDFVIGYAPKYNALLKHVESTGNQELKDSLLDLGILRKDDENNRIYDHFRDRLIFPISTDIDGESLFCGFGGRRIGDTDDVKYINSIESAIFNKSQILFGFNQNTKSTRLLVEGYVDVVATHQFGFDGGCASMGTAITPAQMNQILKNSTDIVIVYDGDAAGISAAKKAIKVALPGLESHHSLKVCILPNKHDPDSYLNEFGKDAFIQELNEARNYSDFLIHETERDDSLDSQVCYFSELAEHIQLSKNNDVVSYAILSSLAKAEKRFSIDVMSKMLNCSTSVAEQCKQKHQKVLWL